MVDLKAEFKRNRDHDYFMAFKIFHKVLFYCLIPYIVASCSDYQVIRREIFPYAGRDKKFNREICR